MKSQSLWLSANILAVIGHFYLNNAIYRGAILTMKVAQGEMNQEI
jgi:hypothetical protein